MDYHGAIQRALTENGLTRPAEVLAAFLHFLRDDHGQTLGFKAAFHDGKDSLTGQHANTLAESILNYGRVMVALSTNNAEVERKSGNTTAADSFEAYAKRLNAFVDILAYFIPLWNFEGVDSEQSIERLKRQLDREHGKENPDLPDDGPAAADPPKRF